MHSTKHKRIHSGKIHPETIYFRNPNCSYSLFGKKKKKILENSCLHWTSWFRNLKGAVDGRLRPLRLRARYIGSRKTRAKRLVSSFYRCFSLINYLWYCKKLDNGCCFLYSSLTIYTVDYCIWSADSLSGVTAKWNHTGKSIIFMSSLISTILCDVLICQPTIF